MNHLPLKRDTVSFIFGEEFIPFLPWTFVIYLSAFFQSLLVMSYMPRSLLYKNLSVLSVAVMVGLILFLLVPLRFPRELYTSNNSFVTFFQKYDPSGNCFPSLHIVFTIVFSYVYSLMQKSNVSCSLMWIWCALIILSVLTTKQPYLIDVLGGIALAIPVILVIKKQTKFLLSPSSPT